MTPSKKSNTREERLLDIIQRISTEAANHMIAVTEAVGELRSYIDSKMTDLLVASAESKSNCALLNEKLDNIADETAATKNAITQLATEIVELEKNSRPASKFDWKRKWWQSKEFFLILVIIMLLILLGSHSGVSLADEVGKLLKAITSIFGKG
jgi:hypothetical protein